MLLAVFRTAVRTKSDGHHELSYKPVTMDDMPVPTIPWKEYHSKTNAKYNAVLVGGIVALASSIYIVSLIRGVVLIRAGAKLNDAPGKIANWRLFCTTTHNTVILKKMFKKQLRRPIENGALGYHFLSPNPHAGPGVDDKITFWMNFYLVL